MDGDGLLGRMQVSRSILNREKEHYYRYDAGLSTVMVCRRNATCRERHGMRVSKGILKGEKEHYYGYDAGLSAVMGC